jgi:hypothetical protein
MWIEGISQTEICRVSNVSIDVWRRSQRLKKLLPKRSRGIGSERRGEDPTPEEIRERAAAIRAGWSSDELARR